MLSSTFLSSTSTAGIRRPSTTIVTITRAGPETAGCCDCWLTGTPLCNERVPAAETVTWVMSNAIRKDATVNVTERADDGGSNGDLERCEENRTMPSVQAYRHEDRTRNRGANQTGSPGGASGRVMSVEVSIVLQLGRRRAVKGHADWIDGADTAGVFSATQARARLHGAVAITPRTSYRGSLRARATTTRPETSLRKFDARSLAAAIGQQLPQPQTRTAFMASNATLVAASFNDSRMSDAGDRVARHIDRAPAPQDDCVRHAADRGPAV
jgi:hypothetical protein